MRRGFLNMFPIDAMNGGEPRTIYDPGKKDNPGSDSSDTQSKVNQSTAQEISVFSSFDKNKDNVGNYQESSSLFTRVNISNYAANYQVTKVDTTQDNNAISNITKLANSKFNAQAVFDKIASGFSATLTPTKITVDGSAEDQNAEVQQKQKDAEKQLNNELRQAAKNQEQDYNTQLLNQYNEALQKAEESYAKDNDVSKVKDNEDNNTALKGQNGNYALEKANNEIDDRDADAKDPNIKTATKAYSQYDINHDGKVTRAEIGNTSKGQQLVSYDGKVSIKPQSMTTQGGVNLDQSQVAAKIAKALGTTDANGISAKAGEYFEKLATSRININSGDFAVDLKGDKTISDDKIKQKLAAAIDKMDQKVETQAKSLNQQINNEVYNTFSKMMNSATTELMLNEAKDADGIGDLKAQELPKNDPKAKQKTDRPSSSSININENAGPSKTRQFSVSKSNNAASDAFGSAWNNTISNLFKGLGEAAATDGAENDDKNKGPDLSKCKNASQVAKVIVEQLGIKKPSTQGLKAFATAITNRNPDVFNSNGGGTQPGVKLSNDMQLNLPTEQEIKKFFNDKQAT